MTGDLALRLVHKIRSEENAILVGTNTALKDNPSLTVRHWADSNPVRAVIDRSLRLPPALNLFDGSAETLIFNSEKECTEGLNTWIKIDFSNAVVPQVLNGLYHHKILSVIVEGGRQLIESFVQSQLWDEMHVFTGDKFFAGGIRAPRAQGKLVAEEKLGADSLKVFRRL
ncbi:MAG: RibD family protein [Mariniphaga sp.]